MKVPFCHIEPDLVNETTAGALVNIKHLLEKPPPQKNSEAAAAAARRKGCRLISLDLFEVPQVWMQQAATLL